MDISPELSEFLFAQMANSSLEDLQRALFARHAARLALQLPSPPRDTSNFVRERLAQRVASSGSSAAPSEKEVLDSGRKKKVEEGKGREVD